MNKIGKKKIGLAFAVFLIILAGGLVWQLVLKDKFKGKEYFLPVELTADKRQELAERIKKDFEMLKLFPKDYNVYLDLGNLEQQLGNASQAINYFKKAWETIPTNSTPWLNIGNIYIALGLYDQAEEAFLKAKNVNNQYYLVYYNLAKLYQSYFPDKASQIRTIYLEGLKNTNNDYQLLQPFTDYLLEEKNYTEAAEYLKVLAEQIPSENKQEVLDKIEEVKGLIGSPGI